MRKPKRENVLFFPTTRDALDAGFRPCRLCRPMVPRGEASEWLGPRPAAAMGRPGAGRSAGRANGRNRIAIIAPCHRVVGSDGALTGYGGGLWRKRYLIDLELSARTA